MRILVKLTLLFLIHITSVSLGLAQTSTLPIGQWQLHVPNNLAKSIAQAEDKIYCATEDGFFLYDKAFNQVKTLSKSDGFSDINISTLGYDVATKTLLIAYENTNIDLLQDGEIININDILRKSISGEKFIYHIYFHNKLAYLSCSFGVVVLDLVKQEIKDTYSNLGPSGQTLKVYSSTILNDSLYLASSNGILSARRSNTNLLDYRNWRTFTTAQGLPPANDQDFRNIASFNNKIYAGVNKAGLYKYNGQTWQAVSQIPANSIFYQLAGYLQYLLSVADQKIVILDKNKQVTARSHPLLYKPLAAVPDDNATDFWVADYGNGLVKLTATGAENYIPSGPQYNSAFRVYSDNKKTYVLGGGYNHFYLQNNSTNGFFELNKGQWQSFNRQLYPNQFPDIQDLVGAVRNPVDGKLYIAGYGSGLLEWEGLDKYKVYTPDNSPLISAIPGNNAYTRLAGITTDGDGNIWVTNRHPEVPNAPGLHVLKPDGTWKSFIIDGFSDGANLEQIIIDDNGFKWMVVSKSGNSSRGLLVYDDAKNRFRHLNIQNGQGGLPGSDVYDLVLDKNSQIWVATDKGVAVFYEPESVFSSTNFNAAVPIIDRRPLLENQLIRAIAVDGGNRKWIGTDTGLWLFNEDADQVISHFTSHNSPLPSDKIIDIAINQGTGEVFIVTEAGLVSYRGTATETADKPGCAMVFPNPVRPGYTGLVGLSGLPNQAIVKITDITGTLVYQTKAEGGTVAWDLHDLKGRRVKGGVYLAYSSTADGSQNCISKIAVIE